jgi:hypothetical protein
MLERDEELNRESSLREKSEIMSQRLSGSCNLAIEKFSNMKDKGMKVKSSQRMTMWANVILNEHDNADNESSYENDPHDQEMHMFIEDEF